jgi:DNA-binding GntR family transcriptional regulator
LTELDLAAQFGISKSPVREALLMLNGEGFVHVLPRRGAVVTELRVEDVSEFYAVREALETQALRLAMPRLDAAVAADLREFVRQGELAVAHEDREAFNRADNALHRRIAEAAGNRQICLMLERIHDQIQRARFLAITTPGRPSRPQMEHAGLVDAMLRGDAAEAEQVLRTHIQNVADVVTELLRAKQREAALEQTG